MKGSLDDLVAELPDIQDAAKFTKQDLFVILQGVTGFFGGVAGKDPFAALGAAIGVAEHYATRCNTGSLQDNLGKLNNWLTFGKEYKALIDSSELDFDKLDVGAVPEVMQVL